MSLFRALRRERDGYRQFGRTDRADEVDNYIAALLAAGHVDDDAPESPTPSADVELDEGDQDPVPAENGAPAPGPPVQAPATPSGRRKRRS